MDALYENIYFQLYVIYWILSSILLVVMYKYKRPIYDYIRQFEFMWAYSFTKCAELTIALPIYENCENF